MHTHKLETKEYGEILVHANSDWSGEAIVGWMDPYEKKRMEVKLPAPLLVQISKSAALDDLRDRLIAFLEQI